MRERVGRIEIGGTHLLVNARELYLKGQLNIDFVEIPFTFSGGEKLIQNST
jgi:hypothetical protein